MRECLPTTVRCLLHETEQLLRSTAQVESIYHRHHLRAAFNALVKAFERNDFEVIRETSKRLFAKADSFCGSMPESSPELLLAKKSREFIRNSMERVVYFCSSLEGDSIKKVINKNNKFVYRKIPLISPGLPPLIPLGCTTS